MERLTVGRSAAPLTRRAIVVGGTTILLVGAGQVLAKSAPVDAPDAALIALEQRSGGRLGVFALDLQTGRTLGHRANERFKLMSSFKGLLAAMVLRNVARGTDSLDAAVTYGLADLMSASPVTQANVARGAMSVREMCEAIMYRSDNAAANLLMRRAGGPTQVTAFLREIGDKVTEIDNYEGQLSGAGLSADSSTPRAIVESMRRIMFGPVLPARERRQWEAWMIGNVVGRTRLRAAFPADWVSGDRTGTGDGICNDFAFARRPHGAPLLLSAYYSAPGMDLPQQEAVLRDVARLVVIWQTARDF